MKNIMVFLLQRAQLGLQEFGPQMALLLLPGGYMIAVAGWVHRHWTLTSVRT